MKIVVGGQIDKEMVAKVLEREFPEATIDIKSDIDAAMAMKMGTYDYYFGACNTGGGGALAMAIAILGANKCLTVASPGKTLEESEVKTGIEEGKIAFGFTPNAAEKSIEMIKKYIGG
ncbi:DUF2620 family protein [Streptobacillus canis]|uniref:DUF2620 family protein n=1 Tax=Streptobacillus canis TaxID=2678686 RepID=UPI0012E132EA|nr:DUF2620 family protein [Streptobacillus canis]